MPKSVLQTTAISERVERELRRVHRVDVAEGVPDGPDAVLERVLENQQERRDEQRREVAERDEAHAEADHSRLRFSLHGASTAAR